VAAFRQPRFWLLLWGGAGSLALVYFIIAASVQPRGDNQPSALNHDTVLLTGEMADFVYAFPPRGAPKISFDYEGRQISLADFRGRAVLVNFWATWCAPCLKELPSLDALQEKLGGRKFEVVAIAADPRGPVGVSRPPRNHQSQALCRSAADFCNIHRRRQCVAGEYFI